MSKKCVFSFNEDERDTFIKMIEILTSDNVLIFSDYAIGAVLSQGAIGKDQPITFITRSLSSAEENYAITRKKC